MNLKNHGISGFLFETEEESIGIQQ